MHTLSLLFHFLLDNIAAALSLIPFAAGVTFPPGKDAEMYVFDPTGWDGTQSGLGSMTLLPIDGMEAYNRESTAQKTEFRFYMRPAAITVIGIPARGITVAGQMALDDDGQDMLRDYGPDGASANTNLGYVYLYDGSTGFAQLVQVGGTPESSRAGEGLHPVSFDLAPQDDAVPLTAFTVGS